MQYLELVIGCGEGGLVFNGVRVSICVDDKVVEKDGGDGCATM